MNQRMMLPIAATLTAFILVVVGSLATYMTIIPEAQPIKTNNTVSAVNAADIPSTAQPAVDLATETLIKQREAAYQKALADANQRIEQANQQVATMNAQLAQAKVAKPAPSAPSSPYALSVEQAQDIALSLAPGARLTKTPEVVSYQGASAYEVVLNVGTLYINAQTGAILGTKAAASAPATNTAASAPATNIAASAPVVAATATSVPVVSTLISPEQAATIAVSYRGSGKVQMVGLQRERGVDFYLVVLDDGSQIIVDAANSQVLYANIRNVPSSADGTSGSDSSDHSSDSSSSSEHDSSEHDSSDSNSSEHDSSEHDSSDSKHDD